MRKLVIIVTVSAIFTTLNLAKSNNVREKDISLLADKIHQSITGTRTPTPQKKEDDGTLLFSNPQHIYDQEKQNNIAKQIPKLFKETMKNESYLRNSPVDEARETIDERSQYAAVIDKAVALQTFQETEKRFEQIANILVEIPKMNDLKGIAELQVRMKGMLAMIQNEATKLQMVTHLSNTEQALINRLKRKRNVQILQQINKKMPTIR
ncbi:hypothetical protein BHOIPH791_15140 [Bartonella henselae]|uniref:TrwJ-like protein n=1 Tax=Bartonella henselae (strain ATCC 49882 / DSM 28221 / CCUG 30454 / Houston 1) TaxID=283166 RepID=Q6G1T1_BARHE|nr:type IV secretion system protein [Bartonella henselae]AAM82206.1 TrwJ-like protein [Bartonella henselae str. Houston-1]ATP12992.1 conjugal transfer protein [Bartonella henselae]ETS04174.1 hypothetical protein Q654_01573 [Bartonella henselae JK 50]ETS05002.1 hypothetical protein Q655_01520 [Bartonella henselae JK 51]MDM9990265.1 type IV secretion system protein [Bartonella henselae]